MTPWKTLSRKTVFQAGKFLTVEMHAIQLPDGKVIDDWSWIVTPDFAVVLAQTTDGQFLCFRQTKYAVEGTSLAPIGGYLEPGEDALHAAQRELLEEAGYESPDWIALGSYAVDSNRGVAKAHLFLARQCRLVSAPIGGDLEEQQSLLLSRAQIEQALAAGEFKSLPWATTVALALARLSTMK